MLPIQLQGGLHHHDEPSHVATRIPGAFHWSPPLRHWTLEESLKVDLKTNTRTLSELRES